MLLLPAVVACGVMFITPEAVIYKLFVKVNGTAVLRFKFLLYPLNIYLTCTFIASIIFLFMLQVKISKNISSCSPGEFAVHLDRDTLVLHRKPLLQYTKRRFYPVVDLFCFILLLSGVDALCRFTYQTASPLPCSAWQDEVAGIVSIIRILMNCHSCRERKYYSNSRLPT